MLEWGEMTSERQWGALELSGLPRRRKKTSTEEGEGEVVGKIATPKPPPARAPIAYFKDPSSAKKEEEGEENIKRKTPKAMRPKGILRKDQKEKIPKEKIPNGEIAKGRIPNENPQREGRRRKRSQMEIEIRKG